jgi:NTE family protein
MANVTPPNAVAPGGPDAGPALCLSGGGFRATLFHLGAVRRLNELGVLARLAVVASVSGGSILNGVLATRWSRLRPGGEGAFTNFDDEMAGPVRAFCRRDLRTPLLIGTRLDPANWGVLIRDFGSVSANFLAAAYEPLYRQCLADLPAPGPGAPRFVFCATCVQTGACWHFHGGPGARMGDFYTGYCDAGHVPVSDAVAASSAFPPGFSALRLRGAGPFSRLDPWGEVRVVSAKRGDPGAGTPPAPVLLTDGGVYDNLGVEPVWARCGALLVSDAGRPFESVARSGQSLVARLGRAVDISIDQVGAVRRRWLVDEFVQGRRRGALWAIHTLREDFGLPDARGYGDPARRLFNRVRTDLDAFGNDEIGCLENHGYALADAALRARAPALCPNPAAPFRWPDEARCGDDAAAAALRGSGRRHVLRDVWAYLTGRTPGAPRRPGRTGDAG